MRTDPCRTEDEIFNSILKNCHDLGVDPEVAQRMVERFLENSRKTRL